MFAVGAGDPTDVTLTADRASSAGRSSTYAGVAEVAVETTVAANVTVQSTFGGRTRLGLTAGSTATVQTTSGPLAVALSGGSSVVLESTGAATAVTGTPGAGDRLQVGTGLLSRIGGTVSATNVDGIVYDDSLDGPSRTFALTGTGLTGGPNPAALTHTNARTIDLRMGLGDDTANVTVGRAAVTVVGNGGTDRVNVTLAGEPAAVNPLDASRFAVTARAEGVAFTAANTAAAAWTLDAGRLTGGGVNLLDAGPATLAVALGSGADTVAVVGVAVPTTLDVGGGINSVRVGGGSLANLAANLTVTAPAGGNALAVDDTASPVNYARPLDVTAGAVRPSVASGVLAFDPARFALTLDLGAANDAVAVRNLTPGSVTTVNGGVGDDAVTTAGEVGTLAVNGNAGADLLTVGAGSGAVTFAGGANAAGQPDRVVIDRSAATTALTGSVTAAGGLASVALTGTPTLKLPLVTDVESVLVRLGGGNDAVSIDTRNTSGPNFSPQSLQIDGGAGDDTFIVLGVTGAADSVTLNGGADRDTVTVVVPGAPQANQFAAVVPNVERLVVDNAGSAAAVAWAVAGNAVTGNGIPVIDGTGADRVEVRGGTAATDSLTVSGSDDARPLDVEVKDTTVTVREGLSVLSQAGDPAVVPAAVTTVTAGLSGARAVAAVPQAQAVVNGATQTTSLVWVAGGDFLTTFRHTTTGPGTNGTLDFLKTLPRQPSADGPPRSLAVLPDGQWVIAAYNSGVWQALQVTSADGDLQQLYTFLGVGARQVVVSPDGRTIAVVENGQGGFSDAVYFYATSGLYNNGGGPQFRAQIFGNGVQSVSFSGDSSRAFITSSSASSGSVQVLRNDGDGKYTSLNTVTNANLAYAAVAAGSTNGSVVTVATDDGFIVSYVLNTAGQVTGTGPRERFAGPAPGGTTPDYVSDVIWPGGTAAAQLPVISSPTGNGVFHLTQTATVNGVQVPRGNGAALLADTAGRTLARPADLAVAGGNYLAVSPTENALNALPQDGFGASTAVTSAANGQAVARAITRVDVSALETDGRYLYALSPPEGAVGVYDRTAGTWATFFDHVQVPAGLAGASLVTTATYHRFGVPGGVEGFAFVLTPASGTLTVFRTVNGQTAVNRQETHPEWVGATSLAFHPSPGTSPTDYGRLYVATAAGVRVYPLGYFGGSFGSPTLASVAGVTKVQVANDRVYVVAGGGTRVVAYNPALTAQLGSVGGLATVSDLAFAGTDIYAVSSAPAGSAALYQLKDNGGVLSLAATYQNGVNGVRGLGRATAVAASTDGRYLFVAAAGGTIAVFSRDPATGALLFAQQVSDGRAVRGVAAPVDLYTVGSSLIVASATGRFGTPGGYSTLTVAAPTTAPPVTYETGFTRVESLTVRTGGGSDTVRQVSAPDKAEAETAGEVAVTLNTQGGGDVVSVLDVGPTGAALTVNLGTEDDELVVNQAVARAATRDITVNAGAGSDLVDVQALGTGRAVVNVNGDGAAADRVQVRGAGVPAASGVTVSGDAAAAGAASYDALVIDSTNAAITPPSGTTGTVTRPGFGTLSYTGLYRNTAGRPDQVFINAAPRPAVTVSPGSIAEGGGVTLSATDASGGTGVSYAWDLDGDGQYNDATGPTVGLSWADLRAVGIDDNGTYPVAVRAVRTGQAVPGLPGFVQSATAVGTLTVTNTAPTVSLTGPGSATIGTAYAVAFAAGGDPGDDRVTGWAVNWGDGTTDRLGSTAAGASHVYATAGDYTVTATATDEDGSYSKTLGVAARPGAVSVSAGGPYTIDEGTGLTATATATGSPVRYEWDLRSNGTIDAVTTTPTLTRSWTELNAAGITDSGAYTLTVTAIYKSGATEYRGTSAAVGLTVANVTPTATLTATPSAVPAGSPAGAVTLALVGLADPADPISVLTADYDFDNNGKIDLANQPAGRAVAVPAAYLTAAGVVTVRAVLKDDDGGARNLFASVAVAEVPVAFGLTQGGTAAEGSVVTLTPTITSVGSRPVTEWRVEWGDGEVSTVSAVQFALTGGTLSHRYADNGTYAAVVTARTAGGQTTVTTSVAVADVAPAVTLSTRSAAVTEGAAGFVLQVSVGDPGTDTVSGYTVDWGDGSTEAVAGDVRAVPHTFATVPAGGTARVRVTSLTNEDGTFAFPSNTLAVTVANAPPVIPADLLAVPGAGVEAQELTLAAVARSVATGAEPLTFEWAVTAPDGRVTTFPAAAGEAFYTNAPTEYAARSAAAYTPADDGTYTVTLTVRDDDGGVATATRTVRVENVAPTIDTFAVPATATEGDTVELRATGSDAAGSADPLTFTWVVTERDTGAATTLVGKTVSFRPAAGLYSVRLTVTDGDGGEATRAADLTVTNSPPVVTPGTFEVPATGVEGGTATFRVAASDAAAGLVYLWRIEGPGGAVDTRTGAEVTFQWPDDGAYTVSVTVTDAGGAEVVVGPAAVAVTNLPPTITSADIPAAGTEGVPLTLTATATDPAGPNDTVQYRWVLTGPGGRVYEAGGATATFTPPQNGDYAVELEVSDREGGVVRQSVGTIAVTDADPTVGPIELPAGPVSEGQTVTLRVPAGVDVAADLAALRYTWTVTPPAGSPLVFDGREVSFVVPDDGGYAVELVVTDGDIGRATRTANLVVGNLDPAFVSFAVPAVGYLGFTVPLAAAFTDVAADRPLAYTWTVTRPGGGEVVLTGASVTLAPDVAGEYAVELVVTDGDGGRATRTATVVVAETTVSVTRFELPDGADEGASATLAAAGVDALGAVVTFTWTVTTPAGETITLTGAAPAFTPADDGTYGVTLTATSANGVATAEGSFVVNNLPPVLTDLQVPGRAVLGKPVALSAAASDPAGAADPLTYTWTVTRPDLTTETLTGPAVAFTPTAPGFYGVRLVVADGDGGEVVAVRTVAATNAPPVASAGGPYTVAAGHTVTLDALTGTTDPDQTADTLAYAWDFDADGVFGEASTVYGDERGPRPTFQAPAAAPLTLPVAVRVTDSQGATADAATTVSVRSDVFRYTLINGHLTLTGTDGADRIEAQYLPTTNGYRFRPVNPAAPYGGPWTTVTGVSAITIDGGDGDDTLLFTYSPGADPVPTIAVLGGGGNDTIIAGTTATFGYVLSGGDGDDTITGSDGNDTIDGGAGSDVVSGRGGDDVITGGAGDSAAGGASGAGDLVVVTLTPAELAAVQDGGDLGQLAGYVADPRLPRSQTKTLKLQPRPGFAGLSAAGFERAALVVVDGGQRIDLTADVKAGRITGATNVTAGTAAADSLAGTAGDDLIFGGGGADTIAGGAGDDTVFGGAGDDVIVGGAGRNALAGGAGNDVFFFDAATATADQAVTDFAVGADKLKFRWPGANQTLLYGTAPAAGRFVYDAAAMRLYLPNGRAVDLTGITGPLAQDDLAFGDL